LDRAPSLLLKRPGLAPEIRSDILNAAAIAFNDRGYGATSIDDVADQLGATKGRIYHYYRSKTDIFLDIHIESLHVLLNRVGDVVRDQTLNPQQRMHQMCRIHATVVMTQMAYQKTTMLGVNRFLLSISAPYQQEARAKINALRDEYEALFVEAIAEGSKQGVFKQIPPRVATKPLLGALNCAPVWCEEDLARGDVSIESVADCLADYCVAGLSVR